MSFTYTQNLPAAGNNPSNDQPNMLTNTNSIANIIAVDHVGFNTATAGQHEQCTFPGVVTPATPAGEASVLFPALGVADNAHPVLNYQNADLTFPLCLIRAYGVFTFTSPSTIATVQLLNVTSVVYSSGTAIVTIPANVLTGTSYAVFPYRSNGSTLPITISSATSFTISSVSANATYAFIVTQL